MKEWFCMACIRHLIGHKQQFRINKFDNEICSYCGMMHSKGILLDREKLMKASRNKEFLT